MIMFWVFAVAMIVVALIFVLRPLFLELNKNDIDRTAQNVAITKERLNELKIELEQDTITQAEYDQTKEELEQSLLNDVEESSDNKKSANNKSYTRLTRYILILSVPIFAISLYAYLGQPELIEGGAKQASTPAGHATSNDASNLGTVEEMVEKLAAKLKEQPNNAEGWFMLARSYMSLKRYQEAVAALEKTNQLIPNNPIIMLRYADALTMLSGGRISGKPFELIKKAVALKPDDPTGLWLIGMGYEELGEYKRAISYWKLLMPLLQDEKSINEVQRLIKRTKEKGGLKGVDIANADITIKEKVSTAALLVHVSIDDAVLKSVSKDDVVFIYAKATQGPPMPLAAVRKQVKDFPLTVKLDDSMAMMPTMKLSNFEKVKVSARIAKSGSPSAKSGDIQSKEAIVVVGQKEKVKLIINNLVP